MLHIGSKAEKDIIKSLKMPCLTPQKTPSCRDHADHESEEPRQIHKQAK